MLEKGLLDEVYSLIPHQQLNALQTVGYKELFAFYNNETTLETAVSNIKQNTRRFAKRQITWFNHQPLNAYYFYKKDAYKFLINLIKKKNKF